MVPHPHPTHTGSDFQQPAAGWFNGAPSRPAILRFKRMQPAGECLETAAGVLCGYCRSTDGSLVMPSEMRYPTRQQAGEDKVHGTDEGTGGQLKKREMGGSEVW